MSIKRSLRLIALLLLPALFLPSAFAEQYSIREVREQAKKGWRKSYAVNGGTITVNIPIVVPEVDAFPILQVRRMPPSSVVPVKKSTVYPEYSVDNADLYFEFSSPSREIVSEVTSKNPTPKDIDVMIKRYFIHEIDPQKAYAIRSEATVADAQAFAKEALDRFFPEEGVRLMPYYLDAYMDARPYDYDKMASYGESWDGYHGLLYVQMVQLLRDIPFFYSGNTAFIKHLGRDDNPDFLPNINNRVALDDLRTYGLDERWNLFFSTLLQESGTLAEDTPLCGVEQALATFERLIEGGALRQVNSLCLGYVGWYDKRDTKAMNLLPYWVLEGKLRYADYLGRKLKRSQNTEAQNSALAEDTERLTLFVDAQTGELVDWLSVDPERSFRDSDSFVKWK